VGSPLSTFETGHTPMTAALSRSSRIWKLAITVTIAETLILSLKPINLKP